MKKEQIIPIVAFVAIAAGAAYYFLKTQRGRAIVDEAADVVEEEGQEIKKRVRQVNSPIHKYMRKAKTAAQ